jgi:hypothetical protein
LGPLDSHLFVFCHDFIIGAILSRSDHDASTTRFFANFLFDTLDDSDSLRFWQYDQWSVMASRRGLEEAIGQLSAGLTH